MHLRPASTPASTPPQPSSQKTHTPAPCKLFFIDVPALPSHPSPIPSSFLLPPTPPLPSIQEIHVCEYIYLSPPAPPFTSIRRPYQSRTQPAKQARHASRPAPHRNRNRKQNPNPPASQIFRSRSLCNAPDQTDTPTDRRNLTRNPSPSPTTNQPTNPPTPATKSQIEKKEQKRRRFRKKNEET